MMDLLVTPEQSIYGAIDGGDKRQEAPLKFKGRFLLCF
jgi:hypothetical protein